MGGSAQKAIDLDGSAVGGAGGFATHVNPQLARLLRAMDLDKRFVTAEGCRLQDDDGVDYLDVTSAYGALPFGHGCAEIWAAVAATPEAGEPILAQPSRLGSAGRLAVALAGLAPEGLDRVAFASTGAEGVEVALKIARSATGRHGILATDAAFHGKTLGALSATGRAEYQLPFGAPVEGFERVPFGDSAALAAKLGERRGELACFVVEPIQGEGGIRVPPEGYLREVRRICSEHDVPLVLDEVQTGLGRTGRMFACEHEHVAPDILVLAKALGGGVVPSAAVLYRRELASEAFALRHASTFAGNALAARVGLRTLELLVEDDSALIRSVATNGEYLRRRLAELRERYPGVVVDVRGRGYLLGLETTDEADALGRQCLLGSLAAQGMLNVAICSYLLNVEHVRVAPTLLASTVLRVEPPLTAGRDECDQLVEGLDRALAAVAAGDTLALLGHLLSDGVRAEDTPQPATPMARARPRDGEPRFAFVVHPLEIGGLRDFDDGLAAATDTELVELRDRLVEGRSALTGSAMVIGSGRVESDTGDTAFGEIVGLPYTARQLLDMSGDEAARVVTDAVELGRDRGAEIVGLGAYTSIVTANAQALGDLNVPVTTGNGFTTATAIDAVEEAVEARGGRLEDATVAVVGASGAIGRVLARLIGRRAARLILVGNPAHRDVALRRLHDVATGLIAAWRALGTDVPMLSGIAADGPDGVEELRATGRLWLTLDVEQGLADADVVLTATSTPEPIVASHSLKLGAVVCDVAQPGNVAPAIGRLRPDVALFDGGIVELPGRRPLGVRYGLPPGLSFACMAETMLVALDRDPSLVSMGTRLSDDRILELGRRARRHGFRLAQLEDRASRSDGRSR